MKSYFSRAIFVFIFGHLTERLGRVNPKWELLRVGKGLLGLRSPVACGNWSGHVR